MVTLWYANRRARFYLEGSTSQQAASRAQMTAPGAYNRACHILLSLRSQWREELFLTSTQVLFPRCTLEGSRERFLVTPHGVIPKMYARWQRRTFLGDSAWCSSQDAH